MNYNKKYIFEKAYWLLTVAMLFLYGMQFMGFPYKLSFVWLAAVLVAGMLWCKKIIVDIPAILLTLGFFSYSYIVGNSLKSSIIFTGLPVLSYLAGKAVAMQKYSFCNAETNSKTMLLALTLGTFTCGLLEKYSRFFRFTEECYSGRYWFDFWDGGIRPATYYMFYAMMTLGCVFWALYIWKQKKMTSTCFMGFIVIELLFFGWVETRTPFLIVAIVMAVGCAMFFWLNRKESYVKKALIAVTVLVLAGVIAVSVVWFGNIFNIQNSALGQMLTHDGGIFGNVRFKAQKNVIMQLFDYPWGGKKMDLAGLKYAHNVWLDIAYTAGLIPFVFTVAYTIFTYVECVRLFRSNEVSQELKYLLIGIFVALHLDYSVEPVLDANLVFWSMGACVSGLIKGHRMRTQRVTRDIQ